MNPGTPGFPVPLPARGGKRPRQRLEGREPGWGTRVSPPVVSLPNHAPPWREGVGGRSPPEKSLFASPRCAAHPRGRLR